MGESKTLFEWYSITWWPIAKPLSHPCFFNSTNASCSSLSYCSFLKLSSHSVSTESLASSRWTSPHHNELALLQFPLPRLPAPSKIVSSNLFTSFDSSANVVFNSSISHCNEEHSLAFSNLNSSNARFKRLTSLDNWINRRRIGDDEQTSARATRWREVEEKEEFYSSYETSQPSEQNFAPMVQESSIASPKISAEIEDNRNLPLDSLLWIFIWFVLYQYLTSIRWLRYFFVCFLP